MSGKHTRVLGVVATLTLIVLSAMLSPASSMTGAGEKSRELILACVRGNLAAVTRLLESGADVNGKDQKGWTALTWALKTRQWSVVKVLLEKGAAIDRQVELGREAVIRAATNGHLDAVRTLLDKGIKIDITDAENYKALIQAIADDNQSEVIRLLAGNPEIVPEDNPEDNLTDEPGTQPLHPSDISFGLPFWAAYRGYGPKHPEGLALADPFDPGRPVTLISSSGVCTMKTASKFPYDIPGGAEFEATHLEGSEKCSGYLGVVGVDLSAIRPVQPSDDKSPVPHEVELEARRVARRSDAVQERWPFSDVSPEIVRVGDVTLVKFGLHTGSREDEPGFFAAVLIVNGKPFELEARCTDDHHFFAVNDRLHLTYTGHCCGCGWISQVVYDLSSGTPRKVYENALLGD
ncbi:MAG: ankyrin repeat domain-containing protein [Desulfomonile tiedjei]|nr:ankyrin repeat domain-containing protein [Desulfomonile tiedjei]